MSDVNCPRCLRPLKNMNILRMTGQPPCHLDCHAARVAHLKEIIETVDDITCDAVQNISVLEARGRDALPSAKRHLEAIIAYLREENPA